MVLGRRWEELPRGVCGGLLVALAVTGCARLDPPPLRVGEQPFDEIHSASYASAAASSHTVQILPRSAYKRQWFWLARPRPPVPPPPYDKIHPVVRQWMATRPRTDRVTLMVTYVDSESIPRFPHPDVRIDRGDPANAGKADTAKASVDSLIARRRDQYNADTTGFASAFDAAVLRNYWLVQATLLEIPLGNVDALSRRPRVVYIRPNQGGRPPQGDGNLLNDPKAGRGRIGSDHYFGLNLAFGWMALLDTGVRTTHALLAGNSPRVCVTDCVTGACSAVADLLCPGATGTLPGDYSPEGHGTSSAAILTGNSQFTDLFRGVTEVWLDSFRVYDINQDLDLDATLRGFELAVLRLNQVIVAEMQEHTVAFADVGLAAEKAFQAGAVVIAANGNDDLFVAGYPANANNVIGVGSFDLETGNETMYQAWGLSSDLRVKPDLVGPTSSETAGNNWVGTTPPDQSLHYYGGTSGATPYVAGAASLVRNWMNVGSSTGVDPGQVYAQLILSGDRVGPFVIPTQIPEQPFVAASAYGAGRLSLPQSGLSRWGKTWVSANVRYVEIPIRINDPSVKRLEAAIWWPSVPGGIPNNLDLRLKGQGMKARSSSQYGVFERVRVQKASGLHGRWRLTIHPTSVGSTPQVVYWGVSMKYDLAP